MKRWMKAIACALIVSLALSLCGFSGQCNEIRDKVLRLHILANSDSQADQQLKLKVRDAVVAEAADLFEKEHDAGEALAAAQEKLPQLVAAAQQVVYDEGYTYTVEACLCHMYFTTRQYETVSLPAGMYDAVRFTIGEGAGHNWWCVVYPPMCVSAATQSETLSDVLNEKQADIVPQPAQYEVRFKVVELFEGLTHRLRSWFGGGEDVSAATAESGG